MLDVEPLRQQLRRLRHGRVRAGCPSLAYLFVARFADGHMIGQTQEDVGVLADLRKGGATGSAFTDVELYDRQVSPLQEFYLFGTQEGLAEVHGVDLRTGALTRYGERRQLDPAQWVADWGADHPERFQVIYQRMVTQHQEVGNTSGMVFAQSTEVRAFVVGWEATVRGKDYHAVIQLVRGADGRYTAL